MHVATLNNIKEHMKITYTTFQPTTIVYPKNDDSINGDSSTCITIKDEGAGCFLAISQAGYSDGIMIMAEEWPVIRTEINRMFQQIEMIEKQQQEADRVYLSRSWGSKAGGTD